MKRIKCKTPVSLAAYARVVLASGKPLMLVNVLDKPVGGGVVNISAIRMEPSGNNLIILPA